MPRLLQSGSLKRGAVSFGKRVFAKKTSKAREARVYFYFQIGSTAGAPAPVTRPHGLGKTPTSYTIIATRKDPAVGPPGQIYDVFPFATRTHITLYCSSDETYAEVVVR